MRTIGILSSDFNNEFDIDSAEYEYKKIVQASKEYFDKFVLINPRHISVRLVVHAVNNVTNNWVAL